jgi:hypothetical protein
MKPVSLSSLPITIVVFVINMIMIIIIALHPNIIAAVKE